MNSPHETERQQQINAGRVMHDGARPDASPRIGTKPGYQSRRPQENRPRPVSRPGPKGHDAIIKDLTQRQALVIVYTREDLHDMGAHVGIITGSDRYTISLKRLASLEVVSPADDVYQAETLVIYKHAMQGFSELKQAV